MTGDSPLYWTCEYCAARPGERCTGAGGSLTQVHAARNLAVEQFRRYSRSPLLVIGVPPAPPAPRHAEPQPSALGATGDWQGDC